MKRIFIVILSCLLLLPLAACTRGSIGENSAAPVTAEPVTDEPSVHFSDHSYNRETDFNKLLAANGNRSSLFETEDVYYWQAEDDAYLRYAEKDGSDFGVVCGRPECVHDNGNICDGSKQCDGYAPSMSFLWMTEGKIWYLNTELWKEYRNACAVIFCMDPDGTNKELVKPVPKPKTVYGDYSAVQYFCFHRGVLYIFAYGGYINDDLEPIQPFLVFAFTLDSEEPELIYDSGEGIHEGSIFPSGEFLYIEDHTWNRAGEHSDKLLRRSAVTGETEILYEGSDLNWIARYWVDEEGNVYTQDEWTEENGSKNVLRLNNGVWEKAFDFEDPDISYSIRSLSDGVVIARSHIVYHGPLDPDIVIWVKRYDGSTVYKGKLPMAWLGEFTGQGMTLEHASLVCGNENELFCEFELNKRNASRSNEPESRVLIKYVFTEYGIEEIFLGNNYSEIVRNW